MPQAKESVQCYIFALYISAALYVVDHFILYRRAEVDFDVNGSNLSSQIGRSTLE